MKLAREASSRWAGRERPNGWFPFAQSEYRRAKDYKAACASSELKLIAASFALPRANCIRMQLWGMRKMKGRRKRRGF